MTELTGLRDRVVFVAGGGANLGRSVALEMARAGAHVAVNVRSDTERAEAVAKEVRQFGVDAVVVTGDVADPDVAAAMVEQVQASLGPVDVLVHCVGYRPHHLVVDTPLDEWRRTFDTNCTSFLHLVQLLVPEMQQRGHGRVIAIGGPDAEQPHRTHGATAASKAALVSLVQSVALEAGGTGVTANVVSPAITEGTWTSPVADDAFETMLAIPRAGAFAEIAFACVYLASEQGAYVTGQTLRVDGGFSLR